MKKLAFPLLALAVLALVGCKSSSLAGTYTADKATLELKEDKTFSLGQGGNNKNTLAGTWGQDGNKLILTGETIDGKPIKEAVADLTKQFGTMIKPDAIAKVEQALSHVEGQVSDDKKSIVVTGPSQGGRPGTVLTFVKSDASSK
jgi:hypothetical protein